MLACLPYLQWLGHRDSHTVYLLDKMNLQVSPQPKNIFFYLNRGSYMSDHVSLNLLKELWKS